MITDLSDRQVHLCSVTEITSPNRYVLHTNYKRPANPSVILYLHITFSLPSQTQNKEEEPNGNYSHAKKPRSIHLGKDERRRNKRA